MNTDEEDSPRDFGPCCCCGRRQDGSVRNIVMLDFRGPSGTAGWGCVVCGLPMQGAQAIACDDCVERFAATLTDRLQWICGGEYIAEGRRVPLAGFDRVAFEHDLSKHPELAE